MELTNYCSPEFEKYFRLYGIAEHKASRTVSEYTSYVNMLCEYAERDFLEIDFDKGQSYIDYLTRQYHAGSLSRKTIKVRLSCYKSIGNYIEGSGKVEGYENPFALIRNPMVDDDHINVTKVPSLSEVDAVLSAAKKDGPMSYLIIALAVRVGLSASSILKIRESSFVRDGDNVYLHFNKRDDAESDAYIPLPKDITAMVENYLMTVTPDDAGHILFNQRRHPLSIRNMDTLIKKIVTDSGVSSEYTLKDFRTKAVMDLVNAGVEMKTIGEFTGLRTLRLQTFIKAKGMAENGGCPADLTNIQIIA